MIIVVEMVDDRMTISTKRRNSRVPQAGSNFLPATMTKTKSTMYCVFFKWKVSEWNEWV